MKAIRTLVVDDHAIVRTGLVALLESSPNITVVGQGLQGDEAIALSAKLKPDVVIMDILMPVKDGIAATREIKRTQPAVKVLILTTSTVSDDIALALEAGADGVTSKNAANETLIAAVRSVAQGQHYISPDLATILKNDPPICPTLTERQREVLDALTRGLSNGEIAQLLDIGSEAVKDHLNALFRKIGAANRAEAVAIAYRHRIISSSFSD